MLNERFIKIHIIPFDELYLQSDKQKHTDQTEKKQQLICILKFEKLKKNMCVHTIATRKCVEKKEIASHTPSVSNTENQFSKRANVLRSIRAENASGDERPKLFSNIPNQRVFVRTSV